MTKPILEVQNLAKEYTTAAGNFKALSNVNFKAQKGEMIAITGESGSGKSTLLNVISGIDTPTQGNILVQGEPVNHLDEEARNLWRGRNIGIVFQFFQLIPTLTIRENILLPMDFCSIIPKKDRIARVDSLLKDFGILDQGNKFPFEMSGGQQQRAAIARSLANNPAIIAADEPTGNLDSKTSELVFQLLKKLQSEGKTILMVTHNNDLAKNCGRIIRVQDGLIVSDTINE